MLRMRAKNKYKQEFNPQLKNKICMNKIYDTGIALKPVGGSRDGE